MKYLTKNKKYTPIVKTSIMDDCFMTVQRLKEGPPNLEDLLCKNV